MLTRFSLRVSQQEVSNYVGKHRSPILFLFPLIVNIGFIWLNFSILAPPTLASSSSPPPLPHITNMLPYLLTSTLIQDSDPDCQPSLTTQMGTSEFSEIDNDVEFSFDWSSDDALNTQSMAWGDVDGDGDLDLAVGNFAAPNQLYLNKDGELSLEEGAFGDVFSLTTKLAWGDVDGDGDLDLAVGNGGDFSFDGVRIERNQLYINNGKVNDGEPRFTLDTKLFADGEPSWTRDIAWGDANGDGRLDLAVGNYAAPNQLYINEIDGWVLKNDAFGTDHAFTTSMSWGDIDNDNDLDLVVGNQGEPNQIYYYDQETGIFVVDSNAFANDFTWTEDIALGDVNGDGYLDLAVGNFLEPNQMYINDQNGKLEISYTFDTPFGPGDNPFSVKSIAWGDVDRDGDLDLAVGKMGGINQLYLNEFGQLKIITGVFGIDTITTNALAWGDVDSDGDLDLVMGMGLVINPSINPNSTFVPQPNRIYYNNGMLTFLTSQEDTFDLQDSSSAVWGDVDSDGDLDLVIGNYNSHDYNRLYINTTGQLQLDQTEFTDYMFPTTSLAWGDIEGDGDLDLAVGNGLIFPDTRFELQANQVYTNDGNGNFTLNEDALGKERLDTTSLAWGDIDKDGDLDLVVGNRNQPNQLFRYDSAIKRFILDPNVFINDASSTESLAWGDVDGDGDLDLAVGNRNQPNQLYLNHDNSLVLQPDTIGSDAFPTTSLAWGDADGDGDLDLAVGNYQRRNQLYFNDGKGGFELSSFAFGGFELFTWSLAWGDADGDGDLDLAVGGEDPNQLYINDGRGNFAVLPYKAVGEKAYSTHQIAWGDIDSDGDLDLASVNNLSLETNKIYINPTNDMKYANVNNPHAIYIANIGNKPKSDFYGSGGDWLTGTIPITYHLFDQEADPVGRIVVFLFD